MVLNHEKLILRKNFYPLLVLKQSVLWPIIHSPTETMIGSFFLSLLFTD